MATSKMTSKKVQAVDGQGNPYEYVDTQYSYSDALQGVCKDCGSGTLNNDLNPAFEVVEPTGGVEILVCNRCGSQHLDLL